MTQHEEFEDALKKHEINCCMFERGVQTLDDILLSRATFLKAAQSAQPSQAVELSGDEIQAIWVEHGIDECDPETFARAILAAINAKQ